MNAPEPTDKERQSWQNAQDKGANDLKDLIYAVYTSAQGSMKP